jgi:23S rRNA (pseudouridine1915-N3)-methyltransferase
MRLTIAAVGRLKAGPERVLAERYRDRAAKTGRAIGFRSLDVVEIDESRSRDAKRRMVEESVAIATLVRDGAVTVVLDERGEILTSKAFSDILRRWRDDGRSDGVFVIGGPDGLAPPLRDKADLILGFGAQSWPHQLVRIMLLEQIYRATTILSGHPYHRE